MSLFTARQWYYQTCTEFGWYQTTASDNQPFGRTLLVDFFYRFCSDLYGDRSVSSTLIEDLLMVSYSFTTDVLYDGAARSNLKYGHIEPEINYVVSTHGTIDPWHAAGVLEDINPLSPTIVIEGKEKLLDCPVPKLPSLNNFMSFRHGGHKGLF